MIGQVQPSELPWGVIGGLIFGGVFVLAITIGVAWGAWTGRDLQFFDSLRLRDPDSFRKVMWIQRVNGVIVMGMSLCGLLASPFTELGIVGVFIFGPLCAIWLWISIRWTTWAWRTKPTPQ